MRDGGGLGGLLLALVRILATWRVAGRRTNLILEGTPIRLASFERQGLSGMCSHTDQSGLIPNNVGVQI